jgi:hypothetical protein
MKRSYVKSTPQFSIKVSPVHKGVYPVFNQYGVQAWAYFGGPKRGWNSKIRKSRLGAASHKGDQWLSPKQFAKLGVAAWKGRVSK